MSYETLIKNMKLPTYLYNETIKKYEVWNLNFDMRYDILPIPIH